MKVFLASATKKVAYSIAIVIILVGLLVSASPILSPILNNHRSDLERFASELFGVTVTIHDVQLSWHGYRPEVSLNQVTFLEKDTKKPIAQVRNIGILVAMLDSLWHRQFVPSGVIITGSNLTIHRAQSGEISVQGFPVFGGNNQSAFAETKLTEIIAWLSAPSRITLNDINISYSDFKNDKQFITLNNLSLENNGEKHTIAGQAVLHQDISTEMTVAIEWEGNTLDISKIKAKIYMYVSGLLLSQWAQSYTWQNWQVNDGIMSAKIWANWNNGAFSEMQVNFQSYGLDLYSQIDKSLHKVNRLSGHIGWKREGADQVLAGEDILIDLPSRLWPVTNFYLKLTPNESNQLSLNTLKIGYLNLQDIQSFLLSSSPVLPQEAYDALNTLKLSGGLHDVSLNFAGAWQDINKMSFSSDFRELNASAWQKFPGIKNLSGNIKWDGQQGDLDIESHRLVIDYTNLFKKPLMFEQVTGGLHWQKDEKSQWLLTLSNLQILNSDGGLNINGTLLVPAKTSPIINLTGHFSMQQADHIVRYLPMRLFDNELENWLAHAFIGGEISSGNIELQGAIDKFPFEENETGKFLVSAKVNNLTLNYAPNWPRVQNLNGEVVFTGRRASIKVDHALVKNIPLKNVQAEIPYLGDAAPQILNVNIEDIQTDFNQVSNFIQSSALQEKFGKLLSKMEMKGDVHLSLGLVVPLKTPEKIQIKGVTTIANTQLKLLPWQLQIKNLKGDLNFTENSVAASNIQGKLFNKPIQLNLATLRQEKNDVVQVGFIANLAMTDLEKTFNVPLSKVAQGSTDITGKINLSFEDPLDIQLNTNLVGVALQLPDPYKKAAPDARDFSAQIFIADNQPLRAKLIYSNLLSAALVCERKNENFKLIGVDLRLGGGEPEWPDANGLYITGDFPLLNWDMVKQYALQTNTISFADLPLRNVDITAKKFDIFGQQLTDVQLQATPLKENWKIEINSPEIAGEIYAPMKFTPSGVIEARFKRLGLHASVSSSQTSIDMKSLPAITLYADEFNYDDMTFGAMTIKATPNDQGFSIPVLQLMSAKLKLQARGSWIFANKTHLQGEAKSEDISGLINSLGLNAHNFVASKGTLKFDLHWIGGPYSPSLAKMTGHAELDLGKGRIVEVGQTGGAQMGIGRMLSIFSLQTIPRRLTFDFSDLFQKGYSFDFIRGNFNLHNGSAYTNNLNFDGPLAKISISGRIGLQKKDYDFTLSITPYVSSGLPVAAGFLTGGPIGGAAALAVSTFLSPAVSKAATYYYEVKGPWDNPSWSTISKDQKK